MSVGVLHGQNGGSSALMLNVVGGLSAPTNPKYATIWIQTDVPINGWDIFSVAPTWESGEGHVYLQDAPSTSGAIPNFSTIDSTKKPYGFHWTRLVSARQRINGKWVNLNAYAWIGDGWTQFSNTFTATINITYPAGSTCTATCGSTTLTAPDTSGTWACKVSASGTWTVTVKNKWSDTVSVTTSGSTVSLDVSKFWLYQPGNTHSNRTGGWKTAAGITGNYTQNSVTFGAAGSNGATLALTTGANASCYMQTNSAVNLSNFTKLVYVLAGTVSSQNSYVSSNPSNPGAWENKAASLREDSVGTKTIDISSLSGSYYIYLGHFTSSSFVTAYVKEVYLQ